MSKDTRTSLQLSVDGKDLDRKVNYGDIIKVKQSPYPMVIIRKNEEQLEWGGRISEFLKWNQNFRTRQTDEGSTDYF
jgi:NAD kinase